MFNSYLEILREVSFGGVECSTVLTRGALVVSIMFFSDFPNRWGADVAATSSDYHLAQFTGCVRYYSRVGIETPPNRFAAYPYSVSENFMFGLPGSADEDKIFLIDFGLSSRSVTTVIYSGRIVARGSWRRFVHALAVSFSIARCVACGPWLRM